MAEPRDDDELLDDEEQAEDLDTTEEIRGRDMNEDTDPDSPYAGIDRDDTIDD